MHYGKHEIDTYQNRNMFVPSRQGDGKNDCGEKQFLSLVIIKFLKR